MKKSLLFLLLPLVLLVGCAEVTTLPPTSTTAQTTIMPPTTIATTTILQESPCKDTPLADGCYFPSGDLDFISIIPEEYTILETFETDMLNQIPRNWLLYMNAEYKPGGVAAKVVEAEANRYVELYSDGLKKPPYPQGGSTPTFIFTTKFNLDVQRKGLAYVDLMVPETGKNAVSAGVATGAVNTISVTINNDYSVFVKVGGPFYYLSTSGDSGDYHNTSIVVAPGEWNTFKFTWDAELNLVQAYHVDGETETLLVSVPFHVSSRFNAKPTGAILVPNVFKVTMPYGQSGSAFLDNVIVEEVDS